MKICEQQSEEKVISSLRFLANVIASSVGNAMAFTPAFKARISVSLRCFPFGRIHPRAMGVLGNINLAVAMTFPISIGFGGATSSISVPCMGTNAMMTKAEG